MCIYQIFKNPFTQVFRVQLGSTFSLELRHRMYRNRYRKFAFTFGQIHLCSSNILKSHEYKRVPFCNGGSQATI